MLTWRGIPRVRQVWGGTALDWVEVRCAFEVYDDDSPETVLAHRSTRHRWPLDELQGISLAAIATLILDTGRIVIVPPNPPDPGGPVGPEPRPLRDIGADLLEDFTDSRRLLDLPLPRTFP